jgi:hypothetical protein
MKIRAVVAELFHIDGRTDRRTDSRNEFDSRNFAKAPKTHSAGALYRRFSNLALVYNKFKINNFRVLSIFLYLNKISKIGKKR